MIAAYLRVSGKGQLEGDGFRRQLEACQAYARAASISIDQVFKEQVTGKTADDDRETFSEMLLAEPSTIIVEGQHRLARDLIVQELTLQKCREAGISVIAAETGTELTESSDPTGNLIRQILGAVAEWERKMIEAKLRAARKACRQRNGRCEGQKPFGALDGEHRGLERMIELRRQGRTLKQIARTLNHEQIPTRSGNPWTFGAVGKIVKRELS